MMHKTKLSLLGIFAVLVFSFAFASAASTVVHVSNIQAPSTVTNNTDSFTFTFDVKYNGTSESMNISFADSTLSLGSLSIADELGMNGTKSEVRSVTGTVSGISSLVGSDITASLVAKTSTGSVTDPQSFTTAITLFVAPTPSEFDDFQCGTSPHLEISDFSVNNLGEGSDDTWEPLDEIEIDFTVENTDEDERAKNVEVEIRIFDDRDNEVTNDFDIDDEKIDLKSISKDDEEDGTFRIREVPADLDTGNYRVAVRVEGEIDDVDECVSESSSFDNDELGNDEYHEIEFDREEDIAVIVKDSIFERVTATCGENDVIVTFPIYNIGEDKEKSTLVNIYNSALGIDELVVVDNLKSGKSNSVTFLLDIPQSAKEGNYKVDVFTFFDYDEDGDKEDEFSYDTNSFDDLDENWKYPLEVVCSESSSESAPTVTALLDSAAVMGKELVIKTNIQNNADEAQNFLVTVDGIQGWAEVVSVTPQSSVIQAGQTTEFTVTLNPTQEGFHSFSINAFADGESYTQPVSVNIAEEDTGFKGLNFGDSGNFVWWLMAGIFLLVLLILIVVIIKLLRRPRREKF